MTTKRLVILLVVLATMATTFFLPRHYSQPVGLIPILPEQLADWWGEDRDVSTKEHVTLGPETDITRKLYSNARGGFILSSIVLAGHDMMTGIHRPERCLPNQGWNIVSITPRVVDIPGWGKLPVTVLRTTQIDDEEGKQKKTDAVFFYFFVGAERTTSTHLGRVLADTQDRLFKGYNERWGMVLLTAEITKDRTRFGLDEKQTTEMMDEFVQKLSPKIIKDGVRPG